MQTFAVIVVAFALFEGLSRLIATPPDARPRATNPALAGAGYLGLVVLFFFEIRVFAQIIAEQPEKPVWFANAPFGWVLREGATSHADALLAIVMVQSALLFITFSQLGNGFEARQRVFTGVGVGAMIALAMTAPFTNPDLYAYIGYGKLGIAGSYNPPAVPFSGEFRIINDHWGLPMHASDYGPLFLAIEAVLTKFATSLTAAVLVNRAFDVAVVLGCAAALRALGSDSRIVTIFILNPAIWYLYVVMAHNDLLVVGCVLLGLLTVKRYPLLAVCAGVAAGAMKISFAAVAVLIFAEPLRSRWWRLLMGLAVVSLIVAVSLGFGGRPYVAAMAEVVRLQQQHVPRSVFIEQRIVAAVGFAAIVAGLAFERWWPAASWCIAAIGSRLYPWYLGWSIPYAIRARYLSTYLIALPTVALLIDPLHSPHLKPFAIVAFLAALPFLVQRLMRARAAIRA